MRVSFYKKDVMDKKNPPKPPEANPGEGKDEIYEPKRGIHLLKREILGKKQNSMLLIVH